MEEFFDLDAGEDAVGAVGGDVGERGFVEEGGLHDTVFGEVVDDEVDELDLAGVEGLAGEGLFGGFAVEANQGTDEEAEAMAFGFGISSRHDIMLA